MTDRKTHYLAGLKLYGAARHAEAVEEYQKALELSPDWTEAMHALATAYSKLGRHDEAIALIEKVIALEPEDAFAKAGALCLDCADLGHLEFLPSGDAALTRRATKASRLSAVVVRWSARRNRYERQGILADAAAIEQAAQECLSDADVRARRRQREQSHRTDQDVRFRSEFAVAICEQFPGCPVDRAEAIALHAAARGSGRVGRSAAGRALDPDAVRLAVVASIRHVDTDYDTLLMSGIDRESARAQVHKRVEDVVNAWRDGVAMLDG